MINKRVQNSVLGCNLKNKGMILVCFQGKPFIVTVIQVYALTSNAEKLKVEWFYEDLQDLLELTHKKDVLFIIGDWNASRKSRDTWSTRQIWPWSTKQSRAKTNEFCQENALVITNTLFQQHKGRFYTWTSPYDQYLNQIDYIL